MSLFVKQDVEASCYMRFSVRISRFVGGGGYYG